MGQIMLLYRDLTMWFSPKEFDELYRLTTVARRHLADVSPLPLLGVPWTLLHKGLARLN
jgi:hypothetical protein